MKSIATCCNVLFQDRAAAALPLSFLVVSLVSSAFLDAFAALASSAVFAAAVRTSIVWMRRPSTFVTTMS